MDSLPPKGTRVSLSGSIGTIRYTGSVNNTTGLWLGIEWDDAQRGKHDGVKDGKRYFDCRTPSSGSFVRPSAHGLSYGVSFLDALHNKYIDLTQANSETEETVVLGSSNGAIIVEAPGMNKVRGKFSRLDHLKEVSLDNELVALGNDADLIKKTCPSIRSLDLSMSLIASWDTVASIATGLSNLQRLSLNKNRLRPASSGRLPPDAFRCLTELQLSDTQTTWSEMETIIVSMPMLLSIEMGYNGIQRLERSIMLGPALQSHPIQSINLDGNSCDDWAHICATTGSYRNLDRLVLSSNAIPLIPPRGSDDPMIQLKHVSLRNNRLNAWSDIDALYNWCPNVEAMNVSGNPLVIDDPLAKYARQLIIARFPTLTSLDAVIITTKERNDCELFYLSHISQNESHASEDSIRQAHPQWGRLCQKHGEASFTPKIVRRTDKLENKLIEIRLFSSANPPSCADTIPACETIRTLPSMTLRALRMKTGKVFRRNPSQALPTLWLQMADGSFSELDNTLDKQGLDWVRHHRNTIQYIAWDPRIPMPERFNQFVGSTDWPGSLKVERES